LSEAAFAKDKEIADLKAYVAELEAAREATGDEGVMLAVACEALDACFKSLMSSPEDIRDLLPGDLFVYWQSGKWRKRPA
jgi:hypothetical protein